MIDDRIKRAKMRVNPVFLWLLFEKTSLSHSASSGQALSKVEWSQFARIAWCVMRIAERKKDKNEPEIGVYSCSFVVKLKKQSQFTRIAYCVMRIAERKLKKQSQFARIAWCVLLWSPPNPSCGLTEYRIAEGKLKKQNQSRVLPGNPKY